MHIPVVRLGLGLLGHDADAVSAVAGVQNGRDERVEVARLRLDHQDDGVVAEVCIGAVEDAEVGQVGDCGAVERFRAAFPDVLQRAVVGARDFDREEELDGAEAGGED